MITGSYCVCEVCKLSQSDSVFEGKSEVSDKLNGQARVEKKCIRGSAVCDSILVTESVKKHHEDETEIDDA